MTKIGGSESGSICQSHGFADPDPYVPKCHGSAILLKSHTSEVGDIFIVVRSYVLSANIKMLKKRSFFTIRSLRLVYN
jgi:hypothetical protein